MLSSAFRLCCIFPHPDDESFLTGGSIAYCAHELGAEVSLYTLTRGESSRHARRLGITPDELARRRSVEVVEAARILGITRFFQGDYPDGGLRDIEPQIIERDIEEKILFLRPHVLLTFDVQGGSGHPDHIVTHHIVKRVFVRLRNEITSLQRLAYTVLPQVRIATWPRKVFGVEEHRIHAILHVARHYQTERAAIHAHRSVVGDVLDYNHDNWMLWEHEYFSFFNERISPPANSLFDGLLQQ